MTSTETVHMAVDAGADALGFVMYPPSSRYIPVARAAELVRETPQFVTTVGLFVNHSAQEVSDIIGRCPFDLLQFSGDETDEFCASFNTPFIKSLRVGDDDDVTAMVADYPGSRGIMLDAKVEGQFGGTGVNINWSMLPNLKQAVTLAGGLTSENVRRAMEVVRPHAVDVSGSVESSPGVKDEQRVRAFIESVREADAMREASTQ
jgi:phosphoribosylanthranilate isomerase